MLALKRTALFLHRWLGIALCAVFLVWFPSGIGMMYWSYPAVTGADRLERSPALDPAAVVFSPAEAAARAGVPAPSQIRLNTFDGRPVYRFGSGGGPETIVYADTAERQVAVPPEMLDRIAAGWTGQPASHATVEPLEEVDQWTIQTFRAASPIAKYTFPSGEHLYISEFSGEVIQYTTPGSRLGAWLGPIPHWLYFTPLRKNGEQWLRVVVWTSGLGTVAAVLGLAVGLWMYSPSRRYRYGGAPSRIPYRGQKRWHMILGLVFGVATATWAFSGMLSVDPFPSWTGGGPGARAAARPPVREALFGRVDMQAFAAQHPRAALERLAGLDVRQLEWTSFAGEPVYLATLAGGDTRVVPLHGSPAAAFDTRRIIDVVTEAAGPAGIREIGVIDTYDLYYLDRRGDRPLPVVRVRLDDAENTRYYIDPKTARVVGTYSSRNWVNRWAYHALHSLDFPWLYNNRPLWDIVVIAFMLGGTALCVTSLVLAWRVLGRTLARVPTMKRATAASLVLVLAAAAAEAGQQAPAAPAAPPAVEPPAWWQPTPEALAPRETPFSEETTEIRLAPGEGMEYKYRLEEGATFLYSWRASAAVLSEMHGQPDDALPGFAEFFEKSEGAERGHGSFVAPFAGIHGWYWENRTDREVTIRLTSAGFYTESLEFRQGQPPARRAFD